MKLTASKIKETEDLLEVKIDWSKCTVGQYHQGTDAENEVGPNDNDANNDEGTDAENDVGPNANDANNDEDTDAENDVGPDANDANNDEGTVGQNEHGNQYNDDQVWEEVHLYNDGHLREAVTVDMQSKCFTIIYLTAINV